MRLRNLIPPLRLTLMACLGVWAIAGTWWRLRGDARSKAVRLAGLILLVPVAYLPNLLVASGFFPYRTRAAVAAAVLFLLLLAAAGTLRRLIRSEELRKPIARWGITGAMLIAAVMAGHHLIGYFVIPSQTEWRFVEAEVRRAIEVEPREPRSVVFFMSDSNRSVAGRYVYDEYGYLSTATPWAPEGMTGLAVASVAPARLQAFEKAKFLQVPFGEEPPPVEGPVWIIDARRLHIRNSK